MSFLPEFGDDPYDDDDDVPTDEDYSGVPTGEEHLIDDDVPPDDDMPELVLEQRPRVIEFVYVENANLSDDDRLFLTCVATRMGIQTVYDPNILRAIQIAFKVMTNSTHIEYSHIVNRHVDDTALTRSNFMFPVGPTLRMSANLFLNHCILGRCLCLNNIPVENMVCAVVHMWQHIGCDCTCSTIIYVLEYRLTAGRMPDLDELYEFIENYTHISVNTDDYCNNKRHHVPTPGLTNLVPVKMTDDGTSCSICASDIEQGSSIFKLPCGHIFHAEKRDCLDSGSIITWLETSKFCPNCNAELSIPKRTSREQPPRDDSDAPCKKQKLK